MNCWSKLIKMTFRLLSLLRNARNVGFTDSVRRLIYVYHLQVSESVSLSVSLSVSSSVCHQTVSRLVSQSVTHSVSQSLSQSVSRWFNWLAKPAVSDEPTSIDWSHDTTSNEFCTFSLLIYIIGNYETGFTDKPNVTKRLICGLIYTHFALFLLSPRPPKK